MLLRGAGQLYCQVLQRGILEVSNNLQLITKEGRITAARGAIVNYRVP